MLKPARSRLALLAAVLASCAVPHSTPRPLPKTPVALTVVATNDFHGWLEPHEASLPDGRVVTSGGAAVFASYVARLREENPGGVVLVDAGDLSQGTLIANLSEGAAVIDTYNALGYDAAALGNHEFDYGPAGPKAIPVDPGDDPFGALAARVAQAKFPILARNVTLARDGSRPGFLQNDGTVLIERKGLRIGIVGLITSFTPTVTHPANVRTLRFGPLAEEAKTAADELRRRGADVLLAIVHAGGHCDRFDAPRDLSSCELHGEIFEMLQALPPGLFDAVIAGHTHTRLSHVVNGMPVVESNAFGQYFGIVDLQVDPTTRRVRADSTRIRSAVPICERVFAGTGSCNAKEPSPGPLVPATFDGKPIVPGAAIDRVLAPYLARVSDARRRPLHVDVPAMLTRNSTGESLLGNALADATREMERADIALLNSGGLRNDLPKGPLTYGALYEVIPFDNAIATLTLTGDEVTRLLEAILDNGHGAPQISGLRITLASCGPKVRIVAIAFRDGRRFDRSATYRLATSDFLALGGDGTGRVLEAIPTARKDLGQGRPLNLRDALAAFLERKGGALQATIDGRVRFDAAACPASP